MAFKTRERQSHEACPGSYQAFELTRLSVRYLGGLTLGGYGAVHQPCTSSAVQLNGGVGRLEVLGDVASRTDLYEHHD